VESLCRRAGHRLVLLTGPVQSGSWFPASVHGADDPRRLAKLVPDLVLHEVYVCGPPPWMDLVDRSLRAAGVPVAQTHDERFGW
jgi:ferredoxin-NADP reductase